MGYEYDLVPRDGGDYRRRRELLAAGMAELASFRGAPSPGQAWLRDPGRDDSGWDEVHVVFGPERVRIACMAPLSEAVRADLRRLAVRVGGQAGADWCDDDGEPAVF